MLKRTGVTPFRFSQIHHVGFMKASTLVREKSKKTRIDTCQTSNKPDTIRSMLSVLVEKTTSLDTSLNAMKKTQQRQSSKFNKKINALETQVCNGNNLLGSWTFAGKVLAWVSWGITGAMTLAWKIFDASTSSRTPPPSPPYLPQLEDVQ